MARERLCRKCRQWHKLDDWPVECYRPAPQQRSGLPAPMVISDHMDPLQSMADGKTYDSKSAMRKGYKERGYVEVGSDYSTKQPEPKISAELRQQVTMHNHQHLSSKQHRKPSTLRLKAQRLMTRSQSTLTAHLKRHQLGALLLQMFSSPTQPRTKSGTGHATRMEPLPLNSLLSSLSKPSKGNRYKSSR